MKCTNCGAELNGKFCTNCGTPAPAEETPAASVPTSEPLVTPNTEFPTFENMPLQNTAMPESTPVSQDNPLSYLSEPVNQTSGSYSTQPDTMPQSNNFGSYQSVQPNQDMNTNSFPQSSQGEIPTNNSYSAGMQFTNAQNNTNTAQNGKKKMSGGKIAIIVIAIVLGVLLLLGIVVGVIIWNIFNSAKKGIEDFSSEFSSALEEEFNYDEDYEFDFNYDYDTEESSDDDYDITSDEEYVYTGDLDDYVLSVDEFYDDFGWEYVIDPEDSNKAILVGLNMYMAEDHIPSSNYTLTVPESIDGKKIEQIYSLYIYDPGIENFNVKLIVPGHIKTVHDYAIEYSDDCLTEVVFEEGVESIGTEAIFRCNKIKKITVPESVKTIGAHSLGFSYNTEYDKVPVEGLTIVTKKNSTADAFAKKHNIKVEYN